MNEHPHQAGLIWAITGASGFVGTNLSQHLGRHQVPLRLLVRTTRPVGVEATTVEGDLASRAALSLLTRDADVVVHAAAYVHRPTPSHSEQEACWQTNVEGTRHLLDAIADNGRDSFVIFISTVNVYKPDDGPLREGSVLGPNSVYGSTKLEAEKLILSACKQGRIRAAILRPSVIIGPGAPGNVGRLISMAKRKVFLQVAGKEVRKSLLPVENLIAAIEAVAAEQPSGGIFNVAGGDPMSLSEIRQTLSETLRTRLLTIPLPFLLLRLMEPVFRVAGPVLPTAGRLRDQILTYARPVIVDDTKLRTEIPYSDEITPRDALRRQIISAVEQS